MRSLETTPEPATSPNARAELPAIVPSVNPARLPISEMCARILYVDDEPRLRALGELVLVRSGYDVDTAVDGAQGWEALQHVHYNLLITDCEMPQMSGLELASLARRAGMRLPIVLTSGSADALGDPAASWLGLAACLPKPFGCEKLVRTVEQALRVGHRRAECADAMISVLAHIARVQPFPHGGINE